MRNQRDDLPAGQDGSRDSAALTDSVRVQDADSAHLPAIHAILTEVIAKTTAIYDDHLPTEAELKRWLEAKRTAGEPVVVALLGTRPIAFATYGRFNPKEGYRRTVEHSVHVESGHRGWGVGAVLLAAIEERARRAGVHVMVGLVDSENLASRRLHEAAGFAPSGLLPEVGWKFGRWLDLIYYHKKLSGS